MVPAFPCAGASVRARRSRVVPLGIRFPFAFPLGLSLGLAAAWLLTLALAPVAAVARPISPILESESKETADPGTAKLGLPRTTFADDTVMYGGTYWAPDSLRWEALRDSMWTFDTGVGSSINLGANPNKPIGYHQTMEGWFGIDETLGQQPYFRRSSTCVIAGSFSAWAGVSAAEAASMCYASGQGYGNSWSMTLARTFAYPGSGSVTFSWKYAVDSEPGFDYAFVMIDTSGTGAVDDLVLATYDGLIAGTGNALLAPGSRMRSNMGPFTLKLVINSDSGYSDEDGAYPSTCGLAAFDDLTLSGAVTHATDFETGSNGWEQVIPTTAVGDFTHLEDVADLGPMTAFCPCNLRDSVLVFFDESGGHPLDQSNLAVSPWIDLQRWGDAGRPGKLIIRDQYAVLPLANYLFITRTIRYYPYICPANGLVTISPWGYLSINYFDTGEPLCTSAGAPSRRDYSSLVAPAAEEVQIGNVIYNLCSTSPFGPPCTGVTNNSPWFDHVRLGVYGVVNLPIVNTTTFDRYQDNFAADGTLNPTSPGRLDQNRLKSGPGPVPGTTLGDTLVARGNGGNTEVRLVFRVRPGPFTNLGALNAHAVRWTYEASLNGKYGTDVNPGSWPNWYSARMDTAEQAGVPELGPFAWMSTFHEADPGFAGTDQSPDPNDSGRLANDILPDHLFTPGSRIDYFIASRYRPPDPRNPGGTNWYLDPDTTNGHFREVEILPSSMAADSSWNCVLYVDHHDDRDGEDQYLEEAGLTAALGTGSGNFEQTRYDRFDNQTPSSGQLSFGRPSSTNYGASLGQLNGYRAVAWHAATLTTGQLTNEDAAILGPWLALPTTPGRRFWGSGEGLAQSMQSTGGAARAFMNDRLGVLANCTGIRLANCPSGTPIDTTYCLPTAAVASSHFASSILPRLRGNGCPDLKAYDLISLNGAVPTARGQLDYVKSGAPRSFASVSNDFPGGTLTRTVLDGFPVGRLRTNNGYFYTGCNDVSASLARTADILDWFDVYGLCTTTTQVSAVPPGEGAGGPVPIRTALRVAAPNPSSGPTRIGFQVGPVPARVRLDLYDVSGRLIRRLVDGERPAGPYEIDWDGRDASGHAVPAGLYFYRLTTPGFDETQKLLVVP